MEDWIKAEGVVILSTLGLIAYSTGDTVAAVIAVTTVSALIALLYFNKYPAKVFPGDTLVFLLDNGCRIVGV